MNFKKLIPPNIKQLSPYVAGKSVAEVREQYGLERISKLASNENRLGCSSAVEKAVMDAVKYIQDYPDPLSGKLRRMIASANGVNEKNILLAAGSESIISVLCRTFFRNHENAVTCDATFVGFFVQVSVRGVGLKKVSVTKDYKFDVDKILQGIDSNTKMVYIANPNNPTGTYIDKGGFEKLVKGVPDNVLLIVDEAYYEYAKSVDDYPDVLSYKNDNIIVLRTFSKAYGLAGMRVGYAIADENLIEQMVKTKLTFEPSVAAQAAAQAAFEDTGFIMRSIDLVNREKEKLYSFFDEQGITYVRSVSNSVMIILDGEGEAAHITQKMLEKGVIIRHVKAFGLPHCIRITIGKEEEMVHFKESFLSLIKSGSEKI